MNIACFVSPHGFGHAARSSAIMKAVLDLEPETRFEVFTKVPEWFFRESLGDAFRYHEVLTDIGMVQRTALDEDVPGTVERLNAFLPFAPDHVQELAGMLTSAGCSLVLCDISPLGIAVAQKAGIPSVLVENFTWDWIYNHYANEMPAIRYYSDYFRRLFEVANGRIQTKPVCAVAKADLVTEPIGRASKDRPQKVRARLGISPIHKAVLITTGGIPPTYSFFEELKKHTQAIFVVPGGSQESKRDGNLRLLPHRSEFFHPDLVSACDAVIGKLGYSTVAEVYSSGKPLAFISRPRFRESPVLAEFCRKSFDCLEITAPEFETGTWMEKIPAILKLESKPAVRSNAAQKAAEFILRLAR